MQELTTFQYSDPNGGETLSLSESWLDEQGTPHFTRRAIGEFLEYSDPVEAIKQIIDRNPFISEFVKGGVKLTTPGGLQEVVLYSPVGFHLICMKANTDKAERVQVAVAHFLEDFRTGKFSLRRAAAEFPDDVTLEQLGEKLERTEYAFVGALVHDVPYTAHRALRALRILQARPSFADQAVSLGVSAERLERVLGGRFDDLDMARALGHPSAFARAMGQLRRAAASCFNILPSTPALLS